MQSAIFERTNWTDRISYSNRLSKLALPAAVCSLLQSCLTLITMVQALVSGCQVYKGICCRYLADPDKVSDLRQSLVSLLSASANSRPSKTTPPRIALFIGPESRSVNYHYEKLRLGSRWFAIRSHARLSIALLGTPSLLTSASHFLHDERR